MNPYLVRFNAPTGAQDDIYIEVAAWDAFSAIKRIRDRNPDLCAWRVTAVCLTPTEGESCPMMR